jgi:hypothetical protein
VSVTTVVNTVYMPTPDGSVQPAPYVMTDEEVARFLRLDGLKDPAQALKRYRLKGWLTPVQSGNNLRYLLPDVLAFFEKSKEENPR